VKLLFENWRNYLKEESLLTEISYDEVLKRFDGKKFKKAFAASAPRAQRTIESVVDIEDIEPKEKAEALSWLIGLAIKKRSYSFRLALPSALETFFQMKRQGVGHLLKSKSLAGLDVDGLIAMIKGAGPAYEKHKRSKINPTFAAKGANKIGETEDWIVYIPENKAAACKLGGNTEWCTAAPGLDYYEQYHSAERPLIIFHHKTKTYDVRGPQEKGRWDKKIVGKEPIKFQFHYDSKQYMDRADDNLLSEEEIASNVENIQPTMIFAGYDYMNPSLNMTKGEIFSELNNIVISLKGKLPAATITSAKNLHFEEERLPNGGFKRTGVYHGAPATTTSGAPRTVVPPDNDEAPWWSTFDKDGDLHSETGPAIKEYGGSVEWHIHGKPMRDEEAWEHEMAINKAHAAARNRF
jgi:hypothetical protein